MPIETVSAGGLGAPVGMDNDPAAQIVEMLTTKQTSIGPDGEPVTEGDRVARNPPEPEEARRRLVLKWIDRIQQDKKHHDAAFKRMRHNGAFTHGDQWKNAPGEAAPAGKRDERYVANIAIRHVQQRTASLYATNPTVIAKKRPRMISTVWDGDMVTLQAAQQELAQAAQQQLLTAQQTGVPVMPGTTPQGAENAVAIITDAKDQQSYDKMLKRLCKTLELLWDYNVLEQTYSFKAMMKLTVRRAIVTSVGYVRLGFQRKMKMDPAVETRIADMMQRLATADRLASDIADGVLDKNSPEAEQLRLTIQALQAESQIIAREGLLFTYPDSTSIIPDKKTKSLRGFLGGDWVTEEFLMTAEAVQETYGVDVRKKHRVYSEDGTASSQSGDGAYNADPDDRDNDCLCVVWETYSRKDGLVYISCDGYPDFLREPAAPETYLDRFWPWFAMVLNEGYSEKELYPKSDIDLLKDMQLELNRARQGLREHRKANRPKMAAAAGVLEDDDKSKLANHPANALIELRGLAPGQKVEEVLQAIKMPAIDPALYDTNGSFEDILRVLGQDQASMGQTTSASATEASVAQSAQHTDLSSVLDDQDEMLTEIATAAGKILLMNVGAETVQRVIGPGAVWPQLTKQDVIENIYLVVRAGSTGRPNKQQEVQNAQVLFPMLQRVPGITAEWMARELIKRLDDRLDLDEAFEAGIPSMDALNRIQGTVQTPPPADPQNAQAAKNAVTPPPAATPGVPAPTPGGGGGAPMAPPMGGAPNDPTAQGDQGGRNALAPPPTNGLLGPRTPPVPGVNGLMPGQGGGPKNTPQGALPVP